jgi:anti-anti-sigma factor
VRVLAEVSWREEPGYGVVTVTGEIDIACVGEIGAALRRATAASSRLVIDLAGVDFIGSTGVNLVVTAYNAVQRDGGWVRLVYREGVVAKVLRAAGLADVLPPYGSVEDAVRA